MNLRSRIDQVCQTEFSALSPSEIECVVEGMVKQVDDVARTCVQEAAAPIPHELKQETSPAMWFFDTKGTAA